MPEHTIAENLQRLVEAKADIAAAITAKGGTVASGDGFEDFPSNIASIHTPVYTTKSITSNGTYDASDDSADGYSEVTVNVPNTYTQADEGKVVSNGALVPQGSDTVTQNGTVDTTLISSLLVNVSGGGGGGIYKLTNPESVTGTNSEFYVAETENYFYFFGRVYINNISSGNALFTFPEGFDISKIGTFIRSIRLLESNNSTVPAAAYTFDTQNRTVQIYLYKEWGDYVAVYSKSS